MPRRRRRRPTIHSYAGAMKQHARDPATAQMLRNDAITAVLLGIAGAGVAALAGVTGFYPATAPGWVVALCSVVLPLPLAVRRRWPWVAAIGTTAMYVAFAQAGALEVIVAQVPLFLGFYSVGAWDANRRRAFWVRVAIVATMAAWLVIASVVEAMGDQAGLQTGPYIAFMAIQFAINIAYYTAGWVFGDRARRQALERVELERAATRIDEQQTQLAEQAVSLERMRIARELHDVVAHHVSAMGVQAGAARRVMDADPERARVALRSVEQSARDAIGELRSMVTSLRTEDNSDSPMPTLDELSTLIDQARATGQHVSFTVVGNPVDATPAIGLTAYRVVQESLTNARKHAGDLAHADVRLRFTPEHVEVEVSDNGRGSSGVPGTGMGLIGMRERVAAVGGTVEAGRKPRGGWLVRAMLPLPLPGDTSATGPMAIVAPAPAPVPVPPTKEHA